jgi:hypothetical protein
LSVGRAFWESRSSRVSEVATNSSARDQIPKSNDVPGSIRHDLSSQILIAQRFRTSASVFESAERTTHYQRHQIATQPYEVFGLLLLDTHHRLIRAEYLIRGTIDSASGMRRIGTNA